MNERIKKLRKVLDLTQQEFADKIGTTRNNIAGYETGRRLPSEAAINLIIAKLNVNEDWLRTGEGEMFLETSDTALGKLATELGLDDFMQGIFIEYMKLDDGQRKVVRDFVRKIANQPVKTPSATPSPQVSEAGPDLVKELAELKRQNREMAAEIAAMKEEDDALEQSLLVKKSQSPSP